MPDPIMIPCEGTGSVSPHWLCPMCGTPFPQGVEIPAHDRHDVLAMIERGDFE